MRTKWGRGDGGEVPLPPAVVARLLRILAQRRCHLRTLPYGHGARPDERPFSCTVCPDVR